MKYAPVICLLLAACQPKYKPVEVQPEQQKPAVPEPPKAAAPIPDLEPAAPKRESHYVPTDWLVLRGLNTRTGELSPALKKIEGGAVEIKGYMVPFADEYESVSEFLLVPEAGMCVHVPPPPMNQIVLVQMTSGEARVNWGKPVAVSGILEIASTDSPYGKVAFKLDAASAEVVDF